MIKRLLLILLATLSILSCSDNSDNDPETSICIIKNSGESFEMEPGDCVTISENSDMNLVLVGFENHIKMEGTDYMTKVTVRLEELNFTWETPHDIWDDHLTSDIDFNGVILTGINEDSYTIYIDNIEFTETDTMFIFHRATLRVNYSSD